MANPAFNLSNWGAEQLKDDVRWQYGMPPAGNANFAWLQHMIYHLAPGAGWAWFWPTVLCRPSRAARARSAKTSSRPIWWTASSPCRPSCSTPPRFRFPSVFVQAQKAAGQDPFFIDARKMGTMVTRKLRELSESDIQKIAAPTRPLRRAPWKMSRASVPWPLPRKSPGRTTSSRRGAMWGIEEQADDGEPFEEKMARLTGELSDLFAQSHQLEAQIKEQLGAIGYEI